MLKLSEDRVIPEKDDYRRIQKRLSSKSLVALKNGPRDISIIALECEMARNLSKE